MSPEPAAPRYRRRNRWPIAIVLVVLVIGSIFTWTLVLRPSAAASGGCNKPAPAPATSAARTAPTTTGAGRTTTGASAAAATTSPAVTTTLGQFTDPNTLAATRPADPADVPLTVLNASTVTGEAKTVTDELRDAGFANLGQQGNDPLYPAADLACYGEIRYGYAGLAEARTVLIIAPCAQLVLDGRSNNTVDLSLGALYQIAPISAQAQTELKQIADAAAPPPVIEGQTVSIRPLPTIPPLPSRANCPR